MLGDLIVVDDEDERLTLRSSGSFSAEVVSEEDAESGQWQKLDSPDEIVKYYDPTDVFGDLADALAEAFPDLAEEAPAEEGEEAEEGDETEEGEEAEEGDEGPAAADAGANKDGGKKAGGKKDGGKEDGDRQ